MAKVIDKYRVVSTKVTAWTSAGSTLLAIAVTAAALFVWTAPDVKSWVAEKESLPAHQVLIDATTSLASVSEHLGVQSVRRSLDAWAAPLQRTTKVGRKKKTPPPVVAPPPVIEPPPPEAGPGERWLGPDDEGGGRIERVLIVGASSIQYYLGTELERRLEADYPGVEVVRLGKLGTGLVRDDVYDWKAEIDRLIEEHKPQVVIAQFGGNDAQPIVDEGKRLAVGAEGWDDAYRERLVEVMDDIEARGALPVFLGMPVMRDKGFSGRIERVNRVTQEAAALAGARYIPTWDLASHPDGSYRADIDYNGARGNLRMADGIHYSRLGAQYVAEQLTWRLEQHVPLVPGDEGLAVAVHREIASAVRGKTTPYVAFVPRDVPKQGLPALILLHGAWDDWTAWSDMAHRDLQRLATEHKVVIVLPDGEPFGWYLDSDKVAGNNIQTYLSDELLPDVAEHLPVDGTWGIGGLSMGGHGAIVTAMRHPGMFRSVSSMSGAVDLEVAKSRKQLQELLGTYDEAPELWQSWSVRHLLAADPEGAKGFALRLSTGDKDKAWTAPNQALHAQLSGAGVPHDWVQVPGGHTWEVWKALLPGDVAWHAAVLHGRDGVIDKTPPSGPDRADADSPADTDPPQAP